MAVLTYTASYVFDPVDLHGHPRAAEMDEARVWGTEIEALVSSAATSGGALVYQTLTQLAANLVPGADASGWVVADATPRQ